MTVGRVGLLVGVAVLVLVANVAASILYMVVHGHVIDLAAGMSMSVGRLFVVSFATKLAAALFGTRLRLARPAEANALHSGKG